MIPPIVPGQREEKQEMVGWKNTFNMRQVTLMNLAASQLAVKNGSRPQLTNSRKNFSTTSSSKSLDLLRKNLQTAINKEIDVVFRKYIEKFFQPAIVNIRNNLGKESVTEDHMREVCKKMLEEAKQMYKTSSASRDSSPYECSDSDASVVDGRFERNSPLNTKRKGSDTDSENVPKKQKIRPAKTTDYLNYKLPIKRDGPKWDPDRITERTLFIMGARANKVLGYGQTRGRLYVRHPELVRYSGDQEDKEWLAAKNLMPPSGGKAYLMILQDIKELTESDDYRNNPNLKLNELSGFEVPYFLLSKIKRFIEEVRTDKKRFVSLDLFDLRSHSVTPPNLGLDSPSTPSVELVESRPGSVHIPETSPSSNHSIMSGPMAQSPLPTTHSLLSPNMLLSLSHEACNGPVMMLRDHSQNSSCLSNILSSQVNSDSSQDF